MYINCFLHSEQFLYTTCSPHVLQKEELLTKISLVFSNYSHHKEELKNFLVAPFLILFSQLPALKKGIKNGATRKFLSPSFFVTVSTFLRYLRVHSMTACTEQGW